MSKRRIVAAALFSIGLFVGSLITLRSHASESQVAAPTPPPSAYFPYALGTCECNPRATSINNTGGGASGSQMTQCVCSNNINCVVVLSNAAGGTTGQAAVSCK